MEKNKGSAQGCTWLRYISMLVRISRTDLFVCRSRRTLKFKSRWAKSRNYIDYVRWATMTQWQWKPHSACFNQVFFELGGKFQGFEANLGTIKESFQIPHKNLNPQNIGIAAKMHLVRRQSSQMLLGGEVYGRGHMTLGGPSETGCSMQNAGAAQIMWP